MLSVDPFVRLWLGAVLAMGLILSAPVASAELLVSETFDYPVGSLHGQNGGIGFAGAWQAQGDLPAGQPQPQSLQEFPVLAGAVAYEGYAALGNSVLTTTRSNGSQVEGDLMQADRPIVPINTAQQSTLFMGFSYQKLKVYSSDGRSGLIELFDSSDPDKVLRVCHYRGLVSDVIGPDGLPTGTTANEVNFMVSMGSLRNSPAGLSEPFTWQSSSAIGYNVPLFVLTKFVFDADYTLALLSFCYSPEALPTEEPAVWDAWVSIPEAWGLNIDTLRLPAEGEGRKGVISEVRVGTEVGDVLLVPEPASLGLLGLGGLLLRRR